MANRLGTRTLPGGDWLITLRHDVPDAVAPALANLILNPAGLRAAGGVHAAMMAAPRPGPAPIEALLPFGPGEVALDVRRVFLSRGPPPKYLALRILRASWPKPGLVLHRDRDNRGPNRDADSDGDRDAPAGASSSDDAALRVRRVRAPADPDAAEFLVRSDEDASPAAEPYRFPVQGFSWIDPPEVAPVRRARSGPDRGDGDEEGARPPPEAPGSASPGHAWGAADGPAPAEYVIEGAGEAAERVRAAAEALEGLLAEARIDAWMPVPHPVQPVHRGLLDVWPVRPPLPGAEGERRRGGGWFWVHAGDGRSRRRAALVCAIRLRGAEVHWIEVETRPGSGESFHSVVLRAGARDAAEAVTALLELCAEVEARWPAAAEIEGRTAAGVARLWRHHFAGGGDGDTGVAPKDRRAARLFDRASVLRALESVAQARRPESG